MRLNLFVGLVTVLSLLTAAESRAQETIFNVPSGDVLVHHSRLYFEGQI